MLPPESQPATSDQNHCPNQAADDLNATTRSGFDASYLDPLSAMMASSEDYRFASCRKPYLFRSLVGALPASFSGRVFLSPLVRERDRETDT